MSERTNSLNSIFELQKTGQLNQLIRKLERFLHSDLNVSERADAQFYLGIARTDKGDYAEGIRLLAAAQDGFQELRQSEKIALCLAEQALNHYRQGGGRGGDSNQAKALELLQEAEDVLKQIEGREQQLLREAFAKVAFYRAVVYSQTGKRETAYQFYQKAYELYQDNPWELAKVSDSLGTYYFALGRFTLARLYYERSIEKKEEVGDVFGLCITFSNLGKLLLERGRYHDAQRYLRKALANGQKIHNHQGVAIYLNELGRISLQLQEIDGAVEFLIQCLRHCQQKYPQTRALAHKNLARACLFKEDPQKGLVHIEQSLKLFQRLGSSEGIGIAKRTEGRLLGALKEYEKAMQTFQCAIEMFRQVHKPREMAATLVDLAIVQQEIKQKEKAFGSLKQALQISEGLNDDHVVQRIQDEFHRIDPSEALKIAIQRQVGKEAAAISASLIGHQEVVTVLFSDIKSFTHFSTNHPPIEVVETLNDYFWEMTHVVMEHNGHVDKFIGDGLMVIFRGDVKGHHPYRAVSAGLDMLERLRSLNRDRKRLGLWEIHIRIGIHAGEVIIGNIGSYEKMDYTAIGSTVNLAQRLEAHARPGTVLISKSAYQQVSGFFTCYRRLPFIPKGFHDEVENWEATAYRDLIRFKPVFVGYGEVVEPQPGVIALEVGNKTVPGVIDHHQEDAEKECTASLIYRYPHLILDHEGIEDIEEVKFVMHEPPDFDTIVAAYFTQNLIEKGVLPTGSRELSEYTRLVDSAMLPKTDRPWETPYGVLQGIFEKNRRYCEQKGVSEKFSNYYRLQRGFYLMEYLCLKVAEGLTLDDPHLFQEDYPFERERKLIREDTALYVEDLKKAEISLITLPRTEGHGEKEVDVLLIKNPKSVLFKDWARGDREHSPKGEGFTMLMANYDHKRYIISVDPVSGVMLKGLGAALEKAEVKKRKQLGKERPIDPQRQGYENSDPWYDGRGPLFNYTIVDAPRNGTVLTEKEIREITEDVNAWRLDD